MPHDSPDPGARIASARRRARVAKLGMGVAALTCFGLGMTLVKANAAGHSRHRLQPLDAPRRFQDIVRRNALQGGLLAPAQAGAGAVTSQS